MLSIFGDDLTNFKPLSGYSGAHIILATKDNKNWFVRKIAKSEEDSNRLQVQANKQKNFITNIIKIPKIINEGNINNCFFFDMEYIRGADAAKYLSTANYHNTLSFTNKILDYLKENEEESNNKINLDLIKQKILKVNEKTKCLNDDIINRIIYSIRYISINETRCHGDLTLENIIIDKDNNLWLLDFLDSEISHYWQDISKLHQDLSGGWYIRKNINISKCITTFIGDEIYNQAVKKNADYEVFHYLMLCYNFIRILPYIKNETEKQFVLSRINYFKERL